MATIEFRGLSTTDLSKIAAAKFAKKLEVCAILVQNEMKAGLSSRDNLNGSHDSAESAGGNPFKVTGRLAGSVTHEVDTEALQARVGTPVPYGAWLQKGTRKMAARPWVKIAYNACIGSIKKILGVN